VSTPGDLWVISMIDSARAGSAGSPISRLLVSRARKIDTPPSKAPTRIDPTPSQIGSSSDTAAAVEAAAIRMPTSAALSSNSTMNEGGSLLLRNASM
jgi:hypothetical protein